MIEKEHIVAAYDTFSSVLNIIYTIFDGFYISVTEFSKLLAIIFNTNKIKPHYINKLLVDEKMLIKTNNITIINGKIIKTMYSSTISATPYCKEICYENVLFYVWYGSKLFEKLDIDFNSVLTTNSAKRACKVLRKYIHINFNINSVLTNLIKLQTIFKYERGEF